MRRVLERQQLQPLIPEELVHTHETQLAAEVSQAPGQGVVAAVHSAGVDEGRGSVELLPPEGAGAAHGGRLHERHAGVGAQRPWVVRGKLKQTSQMIPQKALWFYFCCCKSVWHG